MLTSRNWWLVWALFNAVLAVMDDAPHGGLLNGAAALACLGWAHYYRKGAKP